MPNSNLMRLRGGVSLIIAFVLVAGIVAAPLLHRLGSPPAIAAQ